MDLSDARGVRRFNLFAGDKSQQDAGATSLTESTLTSETSGKGFFSHKEGRLVGAGKEKRHSGWLQGEGITNREDLIEGVGPLGPRKYRGGQWKKRDTAQQRYPASFKLMVIELFGSLSP